MLKISCSFGISYVVVSTSTLAKAHRQVGFLDCPIVWAVFRAKYSVKLPAFFGHKSPHVSAVGSLAGPLLRAVQKAHDFNGFPLDPKNYDK